ncbi:MAG: hypothetical protein HY321_07535 [Armatimonadetes bacterium]|nr:hypothetical protein [Armatimonadota bacterium]
MKKHWAALAAVVLSIAGATSAGAVTFLPVLSAPQQGGAQGAGLAPGAGQALMAPARLRTSVMATFWNLPEVDVSGVSGFRAGDEVAFEPQVVPLVAAEYRLSPRWGIGAWYNPLTLDYRWQAANGTTQDLTRGQMHMWNLHVSRQIRRDAAVQLGVVRYRGTVAFRVQNPYGAGSLPSYPTDPARVGMGGTEIHAWAYKSYRVWGFRARPGFLTAGLGLRQRVSDESPEVGPDFAGQLSAAYSYYPMARLSVDAAVWLADFTNGEALSVRLHTGVTGHF